MDMNEYLADVLPAAAGSAGADDAPEPANSTTDTDRPPPPGDEAEGEDAALDEPAEDDPEDAEPDVWSLDDVPDQKVRVKVDGEERVLTLKECVTRGIGSATLHRRMQKLAEATKGIEEERAQHQGFSGKVDAHFASMRSDPDFVRAWFKRHAPDVFARAAEDEVYERVEEAKLTPAEREAKRVASERAKFEAEREDWEKQRKGHEESQRVAAARQRLQPMVQAAAQKFGLTVDKPLLALIRSQLDQTAFREDRPVEPRDLEQACEAIAKWRGQTVASEPAPAASPKAPPIPPKGVASKPAAARRRAPPATVEDPRDFFDSIRGKHR